MIMHHHTHFCNNNTYIHTHVRTSWILMAKSTDTNDTMIHVSVELVYRYSFHNFISISCQYRLQVIQNLRCIIYKINIKSIARFPVDIKLMYELNERAIRKFSQIILIKSTWNVMNKWKVSKSLFFLSFFFSQKGDTYY